MDAHAALHQKPRIGLLLQQHVACPLLVRVLVSGQSTRGWGQETQESRRLASTPPKASFDRASVRDTKFFVRGVVTRSLASATGHPGKQHQRTGTRQTSFQDNDDNENRSEDSVRPQGLRDGRVDRWSQDPTAVNRSVETPARRVCRQECRLQGIPGWRLTEMEDHQARRRSMHCGQHLIAVANKRHAFAPWPRASRQVLTCIRCRGHVCFSTSGRNEMPSTFNRGFGLVAMS